jgi:dTDP-4-dehydrorhamnose 3,5-epimerase
MEITQTEIADVKVLKPKVFQDARGYFCETYSEKSYKEAGIDCHFVQDNESMSMRGVLRGLHYQAAPHAQAKLIRVVRGAVLDVAVDIRKDSPTFGRVVMVELSEQNKQQIFIPHGFAHGFLVLEDNTIFSYKCDELYNPQCERGIRWDDPQIAIPWPKLDVAFMLSDKDRKQPFLSEVEPFGCESF